MPPEKFFIKRGEKAQGPFEIAFLLNVAKQGKLLSSDEIGPTDNGPWEPVSSNEELTLAIQSEPTKRKKSLKVKNYKVITKRAAEGIYEIEYTCAKCYAVITISEEEAKASFHCPACGIRSKVVPEAMEEVSAHRNAIIEAEKAEQESTDSFSEDDPVSPSDHIDSKNSRKTLLLMGSGAVVIVVLVAILGLLFTSNAKPTPEVNDQQVVALNPAPNKPAIASTKQENAMPALEGSGGQTSLEMIKKQQREYLESKQQDPKEPEAVAVPRQADEQDANNVKLGTYALGMSVEQLLKICEGKKVHEIDVKKSIKYRFSIPVKQKFRYDPNWSDDKTPFENSVASLKRNFFDDDDIRNKWTIAEWKKSADENEKWEASIPDWVPKQSLYLRVGQSSDFGEVHVLGGGDFIYDDGLFKTIDFDFGWRHFVIEEDSDNPSGPSTSEVFTTEHGITRVVLHYGEKVDTKPIVAALNEKFGKWRDRSGFADRGQKISRNASGELVLEDNEVFVNDTTDPYWNPTKETKITVRDQYWGKKGLIVNVCIVNTVWQKEIHDRLKAVVDKWRTEERNKKKVDLGL
ncbi:MAG: hypothetical protein ACR2NF_04330 [Pirellulales bacterium]